MLKKYNLIKKCRLCESKKLKSIFNLGKTPLANSLVKISDLKRKQNVYPLGLKFCLKCNHVQLTHSVKPEIMFENYLYLSNTSKQNREHFKKYANIITKKFYKNKKLQILDIASNDGTFLSYFSKKKFNRVGIDPAKNLIKFAKKNKIKQLPIFFTSKNSHNLFKKFGKFEIITANNVCAHVENLNDFFNGVSNILDKKGVFIFEVSYLADVIQKRTFDTIYHEHLDYHSLGPLINFVKKFKLEIFDFQLTHAQGGSIRIFVSHQNSKKVNISKIKKQILMEKNKYRLFKPNTYILFSKSVKKRGTELKKLLNKLKRQRKKIIGYGAAAKTTTLTSFFKINSKYLNFIVDDNYLKQNLYTPNYKVPIKHSNEIYKNKPDYIIILAWNYVEHILQKHKELKKKNVKFIIPFPEVKIVK